MSKKLLVHLNDKHIDAIEAIIRNGLAKSQTGAVQYALMATSIAIDNDNDFEGEIPKE
jgi:hypothetical protein